MLWLILIIIPMAVAFGGSRPHYGPVSMRTMEELPISPVDQCNSTCIAGNALLANCNEQHCECNVNYLQAHGSCLLCEGNDVVDVLYGLQVNTTQCENEGVPVAFKLKLPSQYQHIGDELDRQNARLRQQQMGFLALQVSGGHLGLMIILTLAILNRKIRRDPTFFNFCIISIFSSVAYSFSLYRSLGRNTIFHPLNPPRNLCLTQAAFINGIQPMAGSATMALVIQLWINLRVAIYKDLACCQRQKRWTTLMLLVLPYILFFATMIPALFWDQDIVIRGAKDLPRYWATPFYCSIVGINVLLRITYVLSFATTVITTIFDVLIVVMLYRHWYAFRRAEKDNGVCLSRLLRIIVFTIYRLVVAITSGTALNTPPELQREIPVDGRGPELTVLSSGAVWIDMLLAAMPLVAFLVLGINAELIKGLKFWRKSKAECTTFSCSA